MKKLFLLFVPLYLLSFAPPPTEKYNTPQPVIITGKVDPFDKNEPYVTLHVNSMGIQSTGKSFEIDSTGSFRMDFTTYYPTDVTLTTHSRFQVVVHPGDSLHIEFHGTTSNRNTIYQKTRFSGVGAKVNQQIFTFMHLYHDYFAQSDKSWQEASFSQELNDFLAWLDQDKTQSEAIYAQYLAHNEPEAAAKIWIETFIQTEDLYKYIWYPVLHRAHNNLTTEQWDVPFEYYETFEQRVPTLTEEHFVAGESLHTLTNMYWAFGIGKKTIKDYGPADEFEKLSPKERIQITVPGQIRYAKNNLWLQTILTYQAAGLLEDNELETFEEILPLLDQYLTRPFFKEPLETYYRSIVDFTQNVDYHSRLRLREAGEGSIGEIVDAILTENKGKIIYIDVWGTWCGPCMDEMPKAKVLHDQFDEKEIAFVYLCVDSNVMNWNNTLKNKEIPGQHYFLDKKQSREVRELFNISGVPYYILIDQQGSIVDKGNHLRPTSMKERFEKMLSVAD